MLLPTPCRVSGSPTLRPNVAHSHVRSRACVPGPGRKPRRPNQQAPADLAALKHIRAAFPGISEDYLGYLREIGPGTVRERQYVIHEAPIWCHEEPLFSWFEARGRRLLVIGDNFSGDLFALDVDHRYRVVELLHNDMEALPFVGSFQQFIREQMLMGADGTDLKVPARRGPVH